MKKNDLKVLIENIEKRSAMFSSRLKNDSFESYLIYFEGFFYGIYITNGIDFERLISSWFQSKTEFKAPNMVWFEQFLICYKDKSEQEKIIIFFNLIKSFVDELPD